MGAGRAAGGLLGAPTFELRRGDRTIYTNRGLFPRRGVVESIFRWVVRRLMGFGRLFMRGGVHYNNVLHGFVGTRALISGVRSGLFDALAKGPRSAPELICELELDPDAARILFHTCVAANLLRRHRDQLSLRPGFRTWLDGDGVREDVLHAQLTYDDASRFDECLLGEWPADAGVRQFWGGNYADLSQTQGEIYTDFMQRTVSRSAAWVIKAYPFDTLGSLLDVGGGSGTLAIAVSEAFPKLDVGILDLAHAEERALERIAKARTDRVRFIAGNFLELPLPEGFDAMMLHRVLWDWEDEKAKVLLGRIHAALPSGGRLLVTEGMRTGEADLDVLLTPFDLYMCFGGFRLRTLGQVRALIEEAGFVDFSVRMAQPIFMPLVEARKP